MKKEIEGIKEYFKGLTVSLENIVLLVDFPDGWVLNIGGLSSDFTCELRNTENGIYIIDQFENGYSDIFKCVNTIINVNKEIEAKSILLKRKAQELSELFLNNSLEELENLEFSLTNKKPTTKTQKKNTNKKTNVVEQPKTEKEITPEPPKPNTQEEEECSSLLSSLMNMNNEEIREAMK